MGERDDPAAPAGKSAEQGSGDQLSEDPHFGQILKDIDEDGRYDQGQQATPLEAADDGVISSAGVPSGRAAAVGSAPAATEHPTFEIDKVKVEQTAAASGSDGEAIDEPFVALPPGSPDRDVPTAEGLERAAQRVLAEHRADHATRRARAFAIVAIFAVCATAAVIIWMFVGGRPTDETVASGRGSATAASKPIVSATPEPKTAEPKTAAVSPTTSAAVDPSATKPSATPPASVTARSSSTKPRIQPKATGSAPAATTAPPAASSAPVPLFER